MFVFNRAHAHVLHMLSREPEVADFSYFLRRARLTPATTFRFGWYAPDGQKHYEVSLEYVSNGKATWTVICDDGRVQETIWEQSTNDALLVYNLVNASCTAGRTIWTMLNTSYSV